MFIKQLASNLPGLPVLIVCLLQVSWLWVPLQGAFKHLFPSSLAIHFLELNSTWMYPFSMQILFCSGLYLLHCDRVQNALLFLEIGPTRLVC